MLEEPLSRHLQPLLKVQEQSKTGSYIWSYRIQKEIGATRFGRLPRCMRRIPVPQRDTIGTAAHMTATVANFITMDEGMSQGALIPT